MALIKCAECGKNISDKAKTCIHCGNPIKKEKKKEEIKKVVSKSSKHLKIWSIIIVIGIILGMSIAFIISSTIRNNFDEEYSSNGSDESYYLHLSKNGKCEFRYSIFDDDEFNCKYEITAKNDSGYPKEFMLYATFKNDGDEYGTFSCKRILGSGGGPTIFCEELNVPYNHRFSLSKIHS